MKSTIRLVRALVLDWFDGPLEALAADSDERSYRFRHVGDPPITPKSVHRVWLLSPGTFRRALSLLEGHFGVSTDPVWIPRWDVGNAASRDLIESELDTHLSPADDRIGHCQLIELVGRDVDIVWLKAEKMRQLESLTGDRLWARVGELSAQGGNG